MSEPGAPVPLEKREQLALLREKRAAEQCERLKARCKTQASLMCRLFATKLQEQQAICARAIAAAPGERAAVQAEADAFGAAGFPKKGFSNFLSTFFSVHLRLSILS